MVRKVQNVFFWQWRNHFSYEMLAFLSQLARMFSIIFILFYALLPIMRLFWLEKGLVLFLLQFPTEIIICCDYFIYENRFFCFLYSYWENRYQWQNYNVVIWSLVFNLFIHFSWLFLSMCCGLAFIVTAIGEYFTML